MSEQTVVDLEGEALETWWSLRHMSYTGGQPDLRPQDVDAIATLIRDLAAELRRARAVSPADTTEGAV